MGKKSKGRISVNSYAKIRKNKLHGRNNNDRSTFPEGFFIGSRNQEPMVYQEHGYGSQRLESRDSGDEGGG